MDDDPLENGWGMGAEDAAALRFLRRLVTILTATMILGVLAVVVLLVIRLNQPGVSVTVPAQMALPEGTRVIAVTQTANNILVVTEDETLLIFDASGVEFLRAVQLGPLATPLDLPAN